MGLSVVDTIRGADFQARGLLLSLKAGEPSRMRGRWPWKSPTELRLEGRTASLWHDCWRWLWNWRTASTTHMPRDGNPGRAGSPLTLTGRWHEAQENCDRAETIFRDHCTGVAWKLDTTNAFALWGLSHLGEVAELSRRWPILLSQVRDRGDLYAAMNLSSYLMSVVRLAADDPATGEPNCEPPWPNGRRGLPRSAQRRPLGGCSD